MKFGKCLSASAQELPEDWRQHVVHYSHLKKCINRIVAELEEIGLATLTAEYSQESFESTQPLKLVYSFIGTVENFSPKIEVIVEDNAEETTPEFEAISTKLNSLTISTVSEDHEIPPNIESHESPVDDVSAIDCNTDENDQYNLVCEPSPVSYDSQDIADLESVNNCDSNNSTRALNFVLPTDSEFFGNLSSSINGLTKFELNMKDGCSNNIVKLASLISHTASPYSKDMYIWREIFNLYLDANIWMVNNHAWQKPQSIEKTREQYQWFVQEIARLSLSKKFRNRDSNKALEQFLMLNRDLLSIMQFHELNQTAIRKIIKKHDKRTHLRYAILSGQLMVTLIFTNKLYRIIVRNLGLLISWHLACFSKEISQKPSLAHYTRSY
ncbi:hypothetical protein K7432_010376 [Basidiobolus ranarum]|uniref:SPX domain-containing protein n=1 Tax=Basidiobolus ranarum TaxID=34480 RepID=A0ABR2VVY9_9FUNG